MKRFFVCICLATAVVFAFCGCAGSSGEENAEKTDMVKEQVFYASFAVPKGWYSKSVRPYPAEEKSYEYEGGLWYSVTFVQADGTATLDKELEKASSPFYPVPENMKETITVERKDVELEHVSGRQIICTVKADGDMIPKDSKQIITGLETKEGFYPVSYTHLDVYKRQGKTFPDSERRNISRSSGCISSAVYDFPVSADLQPDSAEAD